MVKKKNFVSKIFICGASHFYTHGYSPILKPVTLKLERRNAGMHFRHRSSSVWLVSTEGNRQCDDEDYSRREFGDLLLSGTASSLIGTSTANFLIPSKAGAKVEVGNKIKETNSATLRDGSVVPFMSSFQKYRHLTLSNGLRVILVNDKRRPQSYASASLSIGGAGQFSDPNDLPGLAHLMEHMTLSSKYKYQSKTCDFEEWLGDRDGASNAFTGADLVNFYFNIASEYFQEALKNFCSLFLQEGVQSVCLDKSILAREIRRVDSELDISSDASRDFYLFKYLMSSSHPFSRFGAGSLETLETYPTNVGIDVGKRLYEFFKRYYLPQKAVLVVIGPMDFATLERWVLPFSAILSQNNAKEMLRSRQPYPQPFPPQFESRLTQIVLLKFPKNKTPYNERTPRLSMKWPLELIYDDTISSVITASSVGFMLSQILGRRGPQSLYRFLRRKEWNIEGTQGIPRISFPVDVSGFQILKLEICLTDEGFASRSLVIGAVYDCIASVLQITPPARPFVLSRELIRQFITIAYINGYAFAPRPPDAIELAVDSQTFGVDSPNGVGVPGKWPLMPSVDDLAAVDDLRYILANTLKTMKNPYQTVISVSATPRTLFLSGNLGFGNIPPLASSLWKEEPISGARYIEEGIINGLDGLVKRLVEKDKAEFRPAFVNPFIPPKLRPARSIMQSSNKQISTLDDANFLYVDDTTGPANGLWRNFLLNDAENNIQFDQRKKGHNWKLWQIAPFSAGTASLPLPMVFRESLPLCSFVIQILSARPARASSKEAAHAELWRLSFENAITDLAELGAPGALSYDLDFNRWGMRICFRGISQTIPSYARRFSRRFVEHHTKLLDGTEMLLPENVDTAVSAVKRFNRIGSRKRQLIALICDSNAQDVGNEGKAFLESCGDCVCIAQGDFLPSEAVALRGDLEDIFQPYISNKRRNAAFPELSEVLYKPMWKPRSSASPCFLPGANFISDACGRIQR